MSTEAPDTLRSRQRSIKLLFGLAGLTAALANAYQPELRAMRAVAKDAVLSFVASHPAKTADIIPPAVK